MRKQHRGRLAGCLIAALLMSAFGCAGHSARTQQARGALDARAPTRALALYNEELGVESPEHLPKDVGGDNALLLLDRSLILQQLGEHQLSSRDLEIADKQIEILDFSRGAADELGKYLFSDDTGAYKAPTYEKLMINTMNMVNYLARGDLNGGRIEARRFAVMRQHLKDQEDVSAQLTGAGSYLAGFIFEKSNEPQTAMRYYDEALEYGRFRTLEPTIVRLSKRASYRTPRINEILKRLGSSSGSMQSTTPATDVSSSEPASDDEPSNETKAPTGLAASDPETESAELLVIINFGRVPAKIAKRVPIGLALTYASGFISPTDHARANALAAQGLVTWVNYPDLAKPRGGYEVPMFLIDGETQNLDGVPVDRHAVQAWEESKGAIVASAITRMIARLVAGETARQAAGKGITGLLASLVTQATLTAVDTPDTRSWSTLPARVAIGRVRLTPGRHTVRLGARGERPEHVVELKPRGWVALNLTVLR